MTERLKVAAEFLQLVQRERLPSAGYAVISITCQIRLCIFIQGQEGNVRHCCRKFPHTCTCSCLCVTAYVLMGVIHLQGLHIASTTNTAAGYGLLS